MKKIYYFLFIVLTFVTLNSTVLLAEDNKNLEELQVISEYKKSGGLEGHISLPSAIDMSNVKIAVFENGKDSVEMEEKPLFLRVFI